MAVVLSDSKRERNALQWSQQFSVALEDCHNHLKEIFEAKQLDHSTCDFCIETSKTNQPSTVLCTPESLARRFSVLLAMLTDKTVASVTVPMGEVLNLSICLCNTTFLHHITKDVGGAKLLNVFLDVLIQLEMQTGTAALFRLSSKKIAAKVLLPLFDLTSHMVADMINSWASVRSLVYRLTANMVLHGSLAYATLNDLIVANLFGFLKDLGLTETEVVWKEQEKPAVFLSKSAKKNRKRQKLQESLLEVAVVLKQPVETWKVALMLNCANLVLNSIYSSAAFLKPEVFRTLQARVIKFCLKMQIDIPYEDDSSLFSYPQCRQHLYTILKALMVCPNPQATPALNCAIRIFAIGRKDLSPQVAQICLEAGAICTQISRPRVRCWDHPGSDSLENHQFLFRDEEITHETEEMEQPITVDRAAVDLPILTEESDVHELLSSSEITAIQSDRKRPQKVTEVIIGSDESSEDESDDEVICTFAQSGPSTFHCELPTITQLPAVKKSEEKSDEDDNGDVTVEEMLNDFVDV